MLLVLILLAVFCFPYSLGYHEYLSPIYARIAEVLIVLYYTKSIRRDTRLLFLVAFLALFFFNYKGLDYMVYTIRMFLILLVVRTRYPNRIELLLSWLVYTLFLLIRLMQGINEPGLFMEFNLEGVLWLALTVAISKGISSKYLRSAFLISANILLIILDAKAIFIALFLYTFWSAIRRIWPYVFSLVILFNTWDGIISKLMQIDRIQYYVAYVSYVVENKALTLIPNFSQAVVGIAGEILRGKAPGNFIRYGYSTSVAFHAYYLRALYDFGILFGIVLIFLNWLKINRITGIRVALCLSILGLTTNMIYSSFFFVSMIVLSSDARVFK